MNVFVTTCLCDLSVFPSRPTIATTTINSMSFNFWRTTVLRPTVSGCVGGEVRSRRL